MVETAPRGLVARLPSRSPAALVFLLAGAGVARIATANWREGAVLIAGSLLVAAALRVALPGDRAGVLGVRSRGVDVALYAAFALIVLVLGLTITGERLSLG